MLQNVYVFSSCVYIHIRNQTKMFSKINTKNIWTAENISTCARCSIAAVSAIAPYYIEK